MNLCPIHRTSLFLSEGLGLEIAEPWKEVTP
jgi:hypothetical protein